MATLGEPVVGTAVYGPVRTVVWEDGGREAPSYPIGVCEESPACWGLLGQDEM